MIGLRSLETELEPLLDMSKKTASFLFGAPAMKALKNEPRGREGFWWLLFPQALRLAYTAKLSKYKQPHSQK